MVGALAVFNLLTLYLLLSDRVFAIKDIVGAGGY